MLLDGSLVGLVKHNPTYYCTGFQLADHDDSLVLNTSTKGEWTPTTCVALAQRCGGTLENIDRCQNHLLGGKSIGQKRTATNGLQIPTTDNQPPALTNDLHGHFIQGGFTR